MILKFKIQLHLVPLLVCYSHFVCYIFNSILKVSMNFCSETFREISLVVQCLRLRDAIVRVEGVILVGLLKSYMQPKDQRKGKKKKRNIEGMVTFRIVFLPNVQVDFL